MTTGDVERAVFETVLDIARRRYSDLQGVDRAVQFKNIAFSSLDVAELVATLELKLGDDPFSRDASVTKIRTVGDLCDVYLRAPAA